MKVREFEQFLADLLERHHPAEVTSVEAMSTRPTHYARPSHGVRVACDDGSTAVMYLQRTGDPSDDHSWPEGRL